jgi:hypothetical protein
LQVTLLMSTNEAATIVVDACFDVSSDARRAVVAWGGAQIHRAI